MEKIRAVCSSPCTFASAALAPARALPASPWFWAAAWAAYWSTSLFVVSWSAIISESFDSRLLSSSFTAR